MSHTQLWLELSSTNSTSHREVAAMEFGQQTIIYSKAVCNYRVHGATAKRMA